MIWLRNEEDRSTWRLTFLAPLEMCHNIDYDLPTWVNEGLIDILIPAGGAATAPSLDVTMLAELC